VDDGRHDEPVCRPVAPEAIGDEAVRDTAAPLEQLAKEPRGGVAIPAGLEQDVDELWPQLPQVDNASRNQQSSRCP